MYEILKKLYIGERLTLQGLDNAVTKGWITEEQKEEILNSHLE